MRRKRTPLFCFSPQDSFFLFTCILACVQVKWHTLCNFLCHQVSFLSNQFKENFFISNIPLSPGFLPISHILTQFMPYFCKRWGNSTGRSLRNTVFTISSLISERLSCLYCLYPLSQVSYIYNGYCNIKLISYWANSIWFWKDPGRKQSKIDAG